MRLIVAKDPATAALIHPTRADTSYAYWYLFNFDPNFDAEYEPDNWSIAPNDFAKLHWNPARAGSVNLIKKSE